jgi:hypothetical protein
MEISYGWRWNENGEARTFLELLPLTWNQLFFLLCRIFDGEPDPLHLKML